VWHGRRLWT